MVVSSSAGSHQYIAPVPSCRAALYDSSQNFIHEYGMYQ